MKAFRTPIAFLQASLAFLGFCLIGLVFFSQLDAPYNYIAVFVNLFLGAYFGRMVFNMIKSHGVLAIMSGSRASYELDELEPVSGSGVFKLTAKELTTKFPEGKLRFNNGSVAIWGDSNGRLLEKKHQLKAINFDSENNVLNLEFFDDCLLIVTNPNLIMCTNTYLKFLKAKKVSWQIPKASGAIETFTYYNTGKTIKPISNTDWKPSEYDFGIGMNAVYLQG